MSRRIALAEPLQDRLAHAGDEGAGPRRDEEVRALMPGRVVEVAVTVGARVPAGALLLVLEAMKMQNEIRAAAPGSCPGWRSGRVPRSSGGPFLP